MTPTFMPPTVSVSALTTAVFARFEPSPDVARFTVPAGVSIEDALRSLPKGNFHRPTSYEFDPGTRVVQFGPDRHPEFGDIGMICEQPIAQLERVLGAGRLPPTLYTTAYLPHEEGGYDEAVRGFCMALFMIYGRVEMGTLGTETACFMLVGEGNPRIRFGCRIANNDDVGLSFESELTMVRKSCEHGVGTLAPGRGLSDGLVKLSAELLNDTARDSLDGYELLEAGLKRLLEPFVSDTGKISLKLLNGHPFANLEIGLPPSTEFDS